MKKIHTFILTIVTSFMPCFLAAQELETIIDLHLESWGQDQLLLVRTAQLDITEISGFTKQSKVQITRKRPNKVRLEGTWEGETFVNVFDGQGYWRIAPWLGNNDPQEMTPTEISKLSGYPGIDSPLYLAKMDSLEMEYIGEQISDDEPYHVIRINSAETRFTDYFIDPASFQIFKTVERDQGNEKYIYQEVFFKSYRPQAGINMAMEYEIRGRKGTTNIVLTELVLGHGVPNSFFKKPEN
ncbi:MAG: hypothetical protein RIG77_01630 [Cyclobacteriaceae bacterium]